MSTPSYKLFFTNAYSLTSKKKVLVHVLVNEKNIIKPSHLINYENATFLTNYIRNVIKIVDNNGNYYNLAEDIYSNERCMFRINKSLHTVKFINIFANEKVCISKQLENIIKKVTIYNKNGYLLMDGISKNGIFSGRKFDPDNNEIYEVYKDGILINSEVEIQKVASDIKNEDNNKENCDIFTNLND
jgi:hypothetical protein